MDTIERPAPISPPPAYETDEIPRDPSNAAEDLTPRKRWMGVTYEEPSKDPTAEPIELTRKFQIREMVASHALGEFSARLIDLEQRQHDQELAEAYHGTRSEAFKLAAELFSMDWANLAAWILSLRPQPGGAPSPEWLAEHAGVTWCSALVNAQIELNRAQVYVQGNANRLLMSAGAQWGADVLTGKDPAWQEYVANRQICDELQTKKDSGEAMGRNVLPMPGGLPRKPGKKRN